MKLYGLQSIKDTVLRQILEQLQAYTESLSRDYGIQPAGDQEHHNSAPPPDNPTFDSVVGAAGRFRIQIVPPSIESNAHGPVFYEIQTSTTLPFSSSVDVTRYGPNVQNYWEITDTITKHVAVRAKFIDSPYTKLIVFNP